MIIKKSLSISFLFLVCHFNNYSHEIKKILSECTGKVAKQRPELFTQAEQYEQNLINARAQCLQANDCDINQAYKQARHDVLRSIILLANHFEELEQKNMQANPLDELASSFAPLSPRLQSAGKASEDRQKKVNECNLCEKNETTDIKSRLMELLKSSL